MTPIGYSARIPPPGTGNSLADINSDIAFKGNLAFQGHWSGFRVIDISNPTNPTQVYNTEACRHTSGQGDVVVHGNILIRTWDSASNAPPNENPTCMGQSTGLGFEGIHIWDISNPAAPVYVSQLRMAATGNDAGAPAVGCGAHTATGVPDDARGYLYLYVGGSSGTCNGIDIVRIKLSDPTDAKYLSRASHGRAGVLPRQQRADERRRHEGRLRDVRRRQRPRDVQVRHGQAGRPRPARRRARAASRTRR